MLLDFMSSEPMTDRDSFLRRVGLKRPSYEELQRYPCRGLFLAENEEDITRILLGYFGAVRRRWPDSWKEVERQGNVLPKTNGFRALMRFLKLVYLEIVGTEIGVVPSGERFGDRLRRVRLEDADFNTEEFPPGTSGEARLFEHLKRAFVAS